MSPRRSRSLSERRRRADPRDSALAAKQNHRGVDPVACPRSHACGRRDRTLRTGAPPATLTSSVFAASSSRDRRQSNGPRRRRRTRFHRPHCASPTFRATRRAAHATHAASAPAAPACSPIDPASLPHFSVGPTRPPTISKRRTTNCKLPFCALAPSFSCSLFLKQQRPENSRSQAAAGGLLGLD